MFARPFLESKIFKSYKTKQNYIADLQILYLTFKILHTGDTESLGLCG